MIDHTLRGWVFLPCHLLLFFPLSYHSCLVSSLLKFGVFLNICTWFYNNTNNQFKIEGRQLKFPWKLKNEWGKYCFTGLLFTITGLLYSQAYCIHISMTAPVLMWPCVSERTLNSIYLWCLHHRYVWGVTLTISNDPHIDWFSE